MSKDQTIEAEIRDTWGLMQDNRIRIVLELSNDVSPMSGGLSPKSWCQHWWLIDPSQWAAGASPVSTF